MAYSKLPVTFKKRFIKALRSGKYKQGSGRLKQINDKVIVHCCLGVACEIAKVYVPYRSGFATDMWIDTKKALNKIPDPLLGNNRLTSTLAKMNDKGKSFEKIADWIEKHL